MGDIAVNLRAVSILNSIGYISFKHAIAPFAYTYTLAIIVRTTCSSKQTKDLI
jgi:hypothetical protein